MAEHDFGLAFISGRFTPEKWFRNPGNNRCVCSSLATPQCIQHLRSKLSTVTEVLARRYLCYWQDRAST